MLKYRLIIGTLMIIFFSSVLVFDGWLDGSVGVGPKYPVQGSILAVIIAILAVPAQLEFKKLAQKTGHSVFLLVTIPASILLATCYYWPQLFPVLEKGQYVLLVSGLSVAAMFVVQARTAGTNGVIGNCGASILSILYLGLLSSFVLAIRVDFGAWAVLAFIFTVKSADIGAFALGKMIGKHKFSPQISPGKTWEGMLGAAILAGIVGSLFAKYCGIMAPALGAVFGVIFAYIGQLGDLAESMLKRDAQQKDSSSAVPGFGGVLDVIDSPLIAAPFAYIFLWVVRLWN